MANGKRDYTNLLGIILMLLFILMVCYLITGCGVGNETVKMSGGDKHDKDTTQVALLAISNQVDEIAERTAGVKTKIDNTRDYVFWLGVKGLILWLAWNEARDRISLYFKKRKAN